MFNLKKAKDIVDVVEPKEEWIWIDGFKGTDENMRCKDFQYQLGKHYIYEGDVSIYEDGYYLCKSLNDVFEYHKLEGRKNRFFKVRALVKKEDNERYGKFYTNKYFHPYRNDKLVAKEIIFQEEVSIDELFENINIRGIDNINDMQKYIQYGSGFINDKLKNNLFSIGYSELFSQLIVDFYINSYEKALALKEQGVSNDMCAYLLLK